MIGNDFDRCVNEVMEREGISYEEALEFVLELPDEYIDKGDESDGVELYG